MFFLRKAKLDTEPLPIKMSGIRMGERLLQIGIDDSKLLAAMALKIGMSGSTSVVVQDEASATRARSAAAAAGALIDLHVTPIDRLPFADAAFDVVVLHGVGGLLRTLAAAGRAASALSEARRVLRHGGRIIAIEPGPRSGLGGLIRPHRPDQQYEASGGPVAALQSAGFRPARVLWEREGYTFTEGLKAGV
jgi:SAM-dependent methyltransferase